ncbi:polymorphic toxin-type HINT domain-containing protein [Actinoplanes sp. NPDC023936]|uniref:polymorphic toxin-type HINT domain-containing protein n=1 Tax=Actinoplanes sp. NPDC023936 TaxID=3154910 RepID=UPI0033D71C61
MAGSRTFLQRRRPLLSAALGALVGASILVGTPVQAAPPKPEPLRGQVEKLDKVGGEIKGVGRTVAAQKPADVPEPAWPSAGAAEVTLTATSQARRAAAAAGSLPVKVARGAGAAGDRLTRVKVEVLDRAKVPAALRDGVVARLAAPAGSAGGKAAVSIDYSGFRYAYGAGWSSRLRMWSVPECALSTPQQKGCSATPLPATNDPDAGVMTAETTVAAATAAQPRAATMVALAAAPSGASGDFTATSLAPSSTWSTGGSSGSFNWSYPMRSPAAIAGPQPNISLGYSSASVDGRSAATNNQPSWIGEGFEYSPGYIERRYIPCAEDKSGTTNNPEQTGDLCWRSDNATLSLNGGGGELIYQSGKGWHARNEDGSKIEKVGAIGTGEHWKVTTTDGTQYFFGRNSLPGQTATTNSAWTAPVYGNHSGEPCYAAKFSDSRCDQVWRWNLDYVVDVHGNTMSYWYNKETNNYAAEVTSTKKVSYVRGGSLARIDYGTWDRLTAAGAVDRSVTPLAQVVFTTGDRCESDCATHDAAHWPDTPWDQECTAAAANCGTNYSPTFWSTKRLASVKTRVWDTTKTTAAWQDVDSWTLTHTFPSPGDGSEGGLWLRSIQRSGLVGGTVTMPKVVLHSIAKQNRVLTQTNTTNNWQRLAGIETETGAFIQVTYSQPECSQTNLPSSAQDNTKLCYPVIGPDPYSTSDGDHTEWWHKYVVTQVSETDIQLADGHQAPTKNTYYTYEGDPAWHYADDDGFTKPKYKTWSQFRGFKTVTTQVGDSSKTLTKTTYLRGMHGDKGASGAVTVAASLGDETVYDEDQYAGMVREQVVYNGTTSKPVSKTVNVPWRSPATASRTINGDVAESRFVNTRVSYSATALGDHGSRGWRTTRSESKYDDTYGTLVWSQSDGDTAKTGDEQCTTYTYNRNTAKNLTTLPSRVTTTALTCGTAPTSADHVVSDARTFYDGAGDLSTAPTRGLPTRVDGLKDWTAAGGTVWQTTGTSEFDDFGRPKKATDIKGNFTTRTYTPDKGIVTKDVSSNHLNWVTTTEKNPAWGLPTKTTDPNGRVTEVTYDPLGRVAATWNIGWSKATNPNSPSARYTYYYSDTKSTYPYVKSETLNAVGKYDVGYEIFDGFLRSRQTQTQVLSGERVVTDSLYDQHGRVEMTYGAHAEPGAPTGTLWWEPEWSVLSQNRTLYDQAGRVTDSIFLSGDGVTNIVERWRTTTSYEGDRTTVVPPKGGTPATSIVDAQGRTVELRQYNTAAGKTGSYTTTSYTYNAKGQLTLTRDDADNQWTYKYDAKGRRTEAVDPDRGKTTTKYNDYNEQTETTDALGKTLQFTYDSLGRKTAVLDAPVAPATAGTKRAEWIYDKLYTGATVRGQLTQSFRYDGGNTYEWQVRNFTARYQPSSAHYVIPANETGLAGIYVYGYGYSAFNGAPNSISYPAGGNVAGEEVTTVFDATTGLPSRLNTAWSGTDSYVIGQEYSSYGEPTVSTLKFTGGVYAQQSFSYDPYTRRLDTVRVKPETATGTVSQIKYNYDDAGNIVGIANTPQVGAADYQCFQQDALGQLTTAWTPSTNVDCKTATPSLATMGGPAPYWIDWTYDSIGNRKTETSNAAAGKTVRTYQVPPSGANAVRPHSVSAMTTTLPGQTAGTTVSYAYDATGNMTSRPGDGQTLTWDVEGHLAKVTKGSTLVEQNLYDADGNRLIRRDATGQTLYLPGMEIRRQVSGTTATLTGTRYYTFNGQTIASRTVGSQALTWLFSDHQGTQQVAVNAYSQQVQIRRQTPFGTPRGTAVQWPNNKGFVGGDTNPSGLVHLGAREYDPALGRFISVDPIQDMSDPRQWNAYAYANNSPVSSSDPTGALPMIGDDPGKEGEILERTDQKWVKGKDGKFKLVKDPDEDGPSTGSPSGGGGNTTTTTTSGTNGGQKETPGGGLTAEEVKRAEEIRKKNAVDVIVEQGGKILLEFFGIDDIRNCATKGDFKACAMTLAGALPFGKMIQAFKAMPLVLRAGKAVMAWMDDLKWADDVLARARDCRRHSFAPTTRVLMAGGGSKPIKDVAVGDKVIATDPETGETAAKTVTVTHSNEDTHLTELTVRTTRPTDERGSTDVADDDVVLSTTQNHPFWDVNSKTWVGAGDLTPGKSLLRAADGTVQRVVKVHNHIGDKNMRDLTVADIHTYYVLAGTTPVLVHNCSEPWMDHIGEKHVTDTHFSGGPKNVPGKSTFDDGVDPYDLVDDAANFPARPQTGTTRCERVCTAPEIIGVDQNGLPTKVYTVVTEQNGRVVTMHPGMPN